MDVFNAGVGNDDISFFSCWTTKTGRHDIAEISLKVVLNTKNQIKSSNLIKGKEALTSMVETVLYKTSKQEILNFWYD
jgi:hypothetical protein